MFVNLLFLILKYRHNNEIPEFEKQHFKAVFHEDIAFGTNEKHTGRRNIADEMSPLPACIFTLLML